MCDQSFYYGKSTPFMVGQAFAVELSKMYIRKGCPLLLLPLRSTKTRLRSMGSQFKSFCLKMWECAKPSMAELKWDDQQCQTVSSELHISLQRLSHCVAVALSQGIAARNQSNCRGSRPHSRTTHHDGVVFLAPSILFNTVSSQPSVKDCTYLYPVVDKGLPESGSNTCQQELQVFKSQMCVICWATFNAERSGCERT